MISAFRSMALVVILLSAGLASAEDLYVAQSAAGSANASSCANAWALSTVNAVGNWGTGLGKVSPGDTVRFCGTLTGQFTPQGSGTAGNVITFTDADGAGSTTWNKTFWTASPISSSANLSYLRFTAFSINATASGTGQNNGTADAIFFAGTCSHCEFDHLSITNLYVRTPQSRDGNGVSGIMLNLQDAGTDMDDILIHDNVFSHLLQAIFVVYPAGSSSNYQVYNNTFSQVGSGMWIASGDVNRNLASVLVHDNDVSDLSPWSGCFNVGCPGDNWHHCDGLIHIYAAHSGAAVTGLSIYNNYAHGPSCDSTELGRSTTTSWIFVEGTGGGTITAPQIYNNLIVAGSTADGQIYIKGSTSAKVYHNTIVSTTSTSSIGCLNSAVTIRNNVAKQAGGAPVYDEGGCSGTTSDYNDFYGHAWLSSWSEGTHGFTTNPQLDASYKFTAVSPGKDKGIDVSATCPGCLTDRLGVSRPQGTGWDMGAFEFGGTGGGAPAAPTSLRTLP